MTTALGKWPLLENLGQVGKEAIVQKNCPNTPDDD
jgi:hypothetical protein